MNYPLESSLGGFATSQIGLGRGGGEFAPAMHIVLECIRAPQGCYIRAPEGSQGPRDSSVQRPRGLRGAARAPRGSQGFMGLRASKGS